MKKYEVVLVMDPAITDADRKEFLAEFQKKFTKNIIDQDDIGILKLQYDLSGVKGKNSAYFYAFFLQLDADGIDQLKQSLLYTKIILRYALYAMDAAQEILKFQETNQKLQDMIDGRQDSKFGQRVNFFTRSENEKYIIRKALPILRKYTTRFGNIKPRKYTHNTIGTQKKVKQAIIRARELGLLEYIKA